MARTVFTNALVLDGANPAVPGSTVVVDGGRIASAADGPRPDDRVIDLGGRTLMPGLITCHFHSTYDDLGARPTPFGCDSPPAYQAVVAARNLSACVRAGFTAAISAGAAHDIDASMVAAIDNGIIPGPRLVPGSRELSTTGHSNDNTPWYWDLHGSQAAMRVCDGDDEFRAGVREEIRRGAKIIKLFVTGGHGTSAPKHRTELTRDELAAAIDTAHARDVLVRGHITNKAAILMAIELGIDIVDHGDDIDDEVIAALAETGTFLVPSVRFPEVFLSQFGSHLNQAAADAVRADIDRMYEALPKADAAGVRILVGDDYGAVGLPHGSYADELVGYVKNAGVSPLDVLRWATRNGAAAMGAVGRRLGAIEPGFLADLLVVDGDPSQDIAVLTDATRLSAVIKDGEVVSGAL